MSLEAEEAIKAMKSVVSQMGKTVAAGADPHKLTAGHPWLAVGGAAVAGFVGAALAIPSKDSAEQKRIEKLAAAIRAQSNGNGSAAPAPADDHDSKFKALLKKGFALIKPTLITTLTSALAAQAGAKQAVKKEARADEGVTVCDETQSNAYP